MSDWLQAWQNGGGWGGAFRQSLVWRSLNAFSDATFDILDGLTQNDQDWRDTLDVFLTTATLPGHPYNAKFLDKRLRRDSMAERDAWWSTYLHSTWGVSGAVDRIVAWASDISPDTELDEDVVQLCSITLTWMFSTSNRFLRDRATKALVSLLTGRSEATEFIVDRFADIDELYILERIYAVAYGVAMRSNDKDEVGSLALKVYEVVFADGEPPVHILLRDYARGVIERALSLGSEIEIDEMLFRPPYSSVWPAIPSESEIEPFLADRRKGSYDSGQFEWSRNRISSSVMNDDFARYVIGTNSNMTSWLAFGLREGLWQSPESEMANILKTLSPSAQDAWETYVTAVESAKAKQLSLWLKVLKSRIDESMSFVNGEVDVEAERARNTALSIFEEELTPSQLIEVTESLKRKSDMDSRGVLRFDLSQIQRYILWRVFDLGWTTERFGEFDRFTISGGSRMGSKAERIGKKYQWIAYHEILAFIADHFQYMESFREDEGASAFDGSWQESFRDIDPSIIMASKPGGAGWGSHKPTWWGESRYTAWAEEKIAFDWIADEGDLPDIPSLLVSSNPSDGSRWVNTQSYLNWMQPHPADIEPTDIDRRKLWLAITGYFVREQDVGSFMEWAQTINFLGGWMPKPPELHGMHLGEYGWSPAFRYFNQPYYGAEDWVRPGHDCPVSIKTIASNYACESSEFDCSLDEGFRLGLPAVDFISGLGLQWTGQGSDFADSSFQLAAFDPTAHEIGPSALLLREDLMRSYLDENGLALCWTVLGEKSVIGKDLHGKFHGRLDLSGVYILETQGPVGFLNCYREHLVNQEGADEIEEEGSK